MRFIADGPELPDDLLTARDAGQVLFFCGAGVSQAEAKLPNFADLAGRVLSALGSALDSPARRLFKASQDFERLTELTGVVATDRVFGLLEQEFHPEEVRQAVAQALLPPPGHRLDAHRVLLDLSRDAAGVVRLMTTNFDRLFEDCDPDLGSFNPPHLPDPRRLNDFRGIMHIHGRVDPDYQRACDDEFVLSSADFGRAYLADGWATRYIQSLLRRFKIVFVGYSADDPPVQYLLEALNRGDEPRNDLYAFQAGTADQASAQWRHKGVQPIAYDSANGHAALWDTLRAWAERARDIEGWHEDVIAMASAGPSALLPHQRGLVAHLAATPEGARRLAGRGAPLPAEWLSVFDPDRRYAPPGLVAPFDSLGERVDPFEALRLDADRPPAPTDPDDLFSRREVPIYAWDLFAVTDADREDLPAEATGKLRGPWAGAASKLPRRLWHLGAYLVRVAHQPAAVWWASHQTGLHPEVVQQIERALRHEEDRFPPDVLKAWRLLIAAWRDRRSDPDHQRYDLHAIVAQSGWSTATVRTAMEMYRPVLMVEPSFETRLPPVKVACELRGMIRPDVRYPRPHQPFDIPPEQIPYALTLLRAQIEHAITLEREIRGNDNVYLNTTRPEDGDQLDEDAFQMTGLLGTFLNMLSRLAQVERAAAAAEVRRWASNTDPVSIRVRIWAAGHPAILAPDEAAAVFLSLDNETYWANRHERDLLYAIRDRWPDMSEVDRARLEQRLLAGDIPWPVPREDVAEHIAHERLSRLHWLREQGVQFGAGFETGMSALREIATGWEPRFAGATAEPQVGKVRTVVPNTDTAPIQGLPIGRVLTAARDAAGRDFATFVDHRPFRGLADQRPAFALAVLSDAARKGEFPEQEWAALLHATSRAPLSSRLLRAIVHRLSRLSPEQVAVLRQPVSEWMRDRADTLVVAQPEVFLILWDALANALAAHPPEDRFRCPDSSWVDDALNQPAGRLVEALFQDRSNADLRAGDGLPEKWRARLDQVLALPGDARHHTIAMIAPHLNWLYLIDPEWSESRLLSVADAGGAGAEAFWSGYFWAARTPQLPLYTRLKPAFVSLARSGTHRRGHANKLAGMLLAGWADSGDGSDRDTLIPDVELREILIHADDELRGQMLWYLERWSNEAGSKWDALIAPFLKNVWPRQWAVRTVSTSGRLVDLAVAKPAMFREIVELILPVLGPIAGTSLRIGTLSDVEAGIIAKHPTHLLDLLWKVLAEDPWLWPYDVRRVIDTLRERDEVRKDPRLGELVRRDQNR
ncbi:hypothetical protein D0Z70_15800 [Sphingobium terrigena]|uniref:Uncharacterized protein n=1 Tax=Sphingobium terrigena TaxID=2304063 RepID=A0A418YPY8_9SPHN|nr:SIR2 family protein [Sphingobium terrigena]RJG53480.1 hypothetical protein D0Z70_15800 [Sphingobium terrigena]